MSGILVVDAPEKTAIRLQLLDLTVVPLKSPLCWFPWTWSICPALRVYVIVVPAAIPVAVLFVRVISIGVASSVARTLNCARLSCRVEQ